eukprot:CAMPEP_0184016176 /NCGR_PEP_ID=MMETSP0954-20121128/6775_1 /TAXON_ID=627963 /ORGANISM="Aplanochytrium sp, Strain PBS07" /LENGTH=75 /DNA_ID=CAMNT_0026297151 /DNA_START=210 /DNA_END=437 /DNA_ORIENTATION=-
MEGGDEINLPVPASIPAKPIDSLPETEPVKKKSIDYDVRLQEEFEVFKRVEQKHMQRIKELKEEREKLLQKKLCI